MYALLLLLFAFPLPGNDAVPPCAPGRCTTCRNL